MLRKLTLLLMAGVFCFVSANAQAKWQVVKSADGKFTASMPCKPEIEIQAADPEKKTPKGTSYGCTLGATYYQITYTDFEALPPERSLLDVFVEGVTNDTAVISRKPLLLGSIKGQDVVFADCDEEAKSSMIFKWRVYQKGTRIYAVTSTGPDPIPDAAHVSRFLTSFVILR